MATQFRTLYRDIRTSCGDFGIQKNNEVIDYIYRDDIIDAALSVVLLSISDYSSSGNEITPTITVDVDKLLIIYSTALFLLVKETASAFQTRDERFQKAAPNNQLLYVAQELSKLENVDFLVGVSDGSAGAIINAGIRWANKLSTITE